MSLFTLISSAYTVVVPLAACRVIRLAACPAASHVIRLAACPAADIRIPACCAACIVI